MDNRVYCEKCNRVLFGREHDHCMWCGAALPEELRLSEAEKIKIIEQRKQTLEQDRKHRQRSRRGIGDSEGGILDIFGGIGGDSGGDGGGGGE